MMGSAQQVDGVPYGQSTADVLRAESSQKSGSRTYLELVLVRRLVRLGLHASSQLQHMLLDVVLTALRPATKVHQGTTTCSVLANYDAEVLRCVCGGSRGQSARRWAKQASLLCRRPTTSCRRHTLALTASSSRWSSCMSSGRAGDMLPLLCLSAAPNPCVLAQSARATSWHILKAD